MKRKSIIVSLCAVLVALATIIGTIAYLTDRDSITNTFTIGDVQIKLDEAVVNIDGQPLDNNGNVVNDMDAAKRTDEGNNYRLISGASYTKDPTLTVLEGSEESYVRILLKVNKKKELDEIFAPSGANLLEIFKGYDENTWIFHDEIVDEQENTITYEFRYKDKVKADDEDLKLKPLFTSFKVPESWGKDELKKLYVSETDRLEITIEGHAIQKKTFDSENDAWTAFDNQIGK